MNIILLDKDSRRFKASISQFESFIWTERYWEYGDFELVVPLNVRNVSLIGLDDYLKIPTSDTLMIVENIEYVSPVKDEGGKFNITGRSLDSILDRRILFQDYKRSIKAEAFITQMVKACFKDSSNSDRSIDYLYIEENDDPDVETDPVNVDESKGANLGDIVLKNTKDNELGFRINFKNDGSFHFEVFAGKDKKYIVFSENNLLLEEAKVYQSNADLKTFALVSGVDSDITVNVKGSPTGINRRETYSGSYSINKTDPGYRNELELKGKNDLEDHVIVKTIEGQLLNIGKYRLRRDFDLGDLITIQNPYYKAEARITEVIQSWNQEGYLIYPGFMAKDITVLNYAEEEIELPEEEEELEPETPEIPDDQTPTKLINVEIISAIKMYTNFIIGGTSRTYHQIYIPNYDPSDPENRPIKRFGVRLRGILPEGWAAGFYSIYCDVFLGSEQKLGTIKINFNPDDQAFIGEWYSYLTYNLPYIRLYLYVVANEVVLIDILDEQEPFINGLVDIRLNNVEELEYNPSEEGDQLTCQTTYIWENNGNFHRYCSTNSTNVTGIDGIDITVLRQICMTNTSMLSELDKFIESGMRSYEYDTVSLDNTELFPLETGIISVPPSGLNYNIPAAITQYSNETIGNFGWRQTMAEVIKSQLASSRVLSGSNIQEMNLLFKNTLPFSKCTNGTYIFTYVVETANYQQDKDKTFDNEYVLELDNSKKIIKDIFIEYYYRLYTGYATFGSVGNPMSVGFQIIGNEEIIFSNDNTYNHALDFDKPTTIKHTVTGLDNYEKIYFKVASNKINTLIYDIDDLEVLQVRYFHKIVLNKRENENVDWPLNYTVKTIRRTSIPSFEIFDVRYLLSMQLKDIDNLIKNEKVIFNSNKSSLTTIGLNNQSSSVIVNSYLTKQYNTSFDYCLPNYQNESFSIYNSPNVERVYDIAPYNDSVYKSKGIEPTKYEITKTPTYNIHDGMSINQLYNISHLLAESESTISIEMIKDGDYDYTPTKYIDLGFDISSVIRSYGYTQFSFHNPIEEDRPIKYFHIYSTKSIKSGITKIYLDGVKTYEINFDENPINTYGVLIAEVENVFKYSDIVIECVLDNSEYGHRRSEIPLRVLFNKSRNTLYNGPFIRSYENLDLLNIGMYTKMFPGTSQYRDYYTRIGINLYGGVRLLDSGSKSKITVDYFRPIGDVPDETKSFPTFFTGVSGNVINDFILDKTVYNTGTGTNMLYATYAYTESPYYDTLNWEFKASNIYSTKEV